MYFTTIFFFYFKVKVKELGAQSCPTLGTPWTVACQAPLSIGLILQARILPFPSPGALPDPGIEPGSLTLQADGLPSEPPGKPCSRR